MAQTSNLKQFSVLLCHVPHHPAPWWHLLHARSGNVNHQQKRWTVKSQVDQFIQLRLPEQAYYLGNGEVPFCDLQSLVQQKTLYLVLRQSV
jgi:hypothetical protein